MVAHSQMLENGTTITFFEKEIEVKGNKGQSEFKTVDFFTFKHAKESHTMETFAYERYKKQYKDVWMNYEKKKKGTPLSSIFDKKTESFLRKSKIETLESLADLSDESASLIGHSGMEWKKQAEQFLKTSDEEPKKKSSVDGKEMKALLDILSPAQKALLPEEMKAKYA